MRRPAPDKKDGSQSDSPARWPGQSEGELSPEEELKVAFGRAIGFMVAAMVLVVGGGILTIVIAALFFGFLFAH